VLRTYILLPAMSLIRRLQALCGIAGSGRRTMSNLKPTGQSSVGILRQDSRICSSRVSIKGGTVLINLSRSKWLIGIFWWSNAISISASFSMANPWIQSELDKRVLHHNRTSPRYDPKKGSSSRVTEHLLSFGISPKISMQWNSK
jgi:hypothetical protein